MDLLQAENSRLTNEIGELRQTNKGLDTTKFSQERTLTELQLKNQSQQRELEDKNTTIADLKSHLKSLQDAKDSLGDDLKTIKQQHDKLEASTNKQLAAKDAEKEKIVEGNKVEITTRDEEIEKLKKLNAKMQTAYNKSQV